MYTRLIQLLLSKSLKQHTIPDQQPHISTLIYSCHNLWKITDITNYFYRCCTSYEGYSLRVCPLNVFRQYFRKPIKQIRTWLRITTRKIPHNQYWKAMSLPNFSHKTVKCLTTNFKFGYQKVSDKYLQIFNY